MRRPLFAPASRTIRRLFAWPSLSTWGWWLVSLPLLLGMLWGLSALAGQTPVWTPLPACDFAMLAAIALVIPSLGEEIVFRGLLDPGRDGSALGGLGALALFVAWHPAQGAFDLPSAQPVFWEGWFLASVALLGAWCAAWTRWTDSLWPAVATHWVVVVAWKSLFG